MVRTPSLMLHPVAPANTPVANTALLRLDRAIAAAEAALAQPATAPRVPSAAAAEAGLACAVQAAAHEAAAAATAAVDDVGQGSGHKQQQAAKSAAAAASHSLMPLQVHASEPLSPITNMEVCRAQAPTESAGSENKLASAGRPASLEQPQPGNHSPGATGAHASHELESPHAMAGGGASPAASAPICKQLRFVSPVSALQPPVLPMGPTGTSCSAPHASKALGSNLSPGPSAAAAAAVGQVGDGAEPSPALSPFLMHALGGCWQESSGGWPSDERAAASTSAGLRTNPSLAAAFSGWDFSCLAATKEASPGSSHHSPVAMPLLPAKSSCLESSHSAGWDSAGPVTSGGSCLARRRSLALGSPAGSRARYSPGPAAGAAAAQSPGKAGAATGAPASSQSGSPCSLPTVAAAAAAVDGSWGNADCLSFATLGAISIRSPLPAAPTGLSLPAPQRQAPGDTTSGDSATVNTVAGGGDSAVAGGAAAAKEAARVHLQQCLQHLAAALPELEAGLAELERAGAGGGQDHRLGSGLTPSPSSGQSRRAAGGHSLAYATGLCHLSTAIKLHEGLMGFMQAQGML